MVDFKKSACPQCSNLIYGTVYCSECGWVRPEHNYISDYVSELDRESSRLAMACDELSVSAWRVSLSNTTENNDSPGTCPRCKHCCNELPEKCPICGWQFRYFLGELSPEDLEKERIDIHVARNVWLAHQMDEHEFIFGLGIFLRDDAINWLICDAQRGIASAQNMLGEIYLSGTWFDKDENEATVWFKKAIKQDYPKAYFNIAEMYLNGWGVDQSETDALKWYKNGNYAVERFCKKGA